MNKFSKTLGTGILVASILATTGAAFADVQTATAGKTGTQTSPAAITTSASAITGAAITGSAITATAITASAITPAAVTTTATAITPAAVTTTATAITPAAVTTTATAITPAAITGAAVTTTPAITTAPVITATMQTSLKPAVTNTIKKGKKVQISVPENATTGYSWSYTVTGAKNAIAVTSSFVKATPKSNIVGQGGTRVFTINAKKVGTVKLTLNYSRSWDKKTLPIKSQQFTIKVVK